MLILYPAILFQRILKLWIGYCNKYPSKAHKCYCKHDLSAYSIFLLCFGNRVVILIDTYFVLNLWI